ncbi:acetyl-CoA carboxylase biotin carboxyl carrier protein [Actinokineospora enzanensis]|uniref:acetyl-CoA carboxylase biotin carboxyl carrier protein n=1 Tax=Actinokineospora enzanensis TaxID=155975 RepID=UPI0003822B83|nr:biotin/lipoyl-containing protein [Actinokineospora enzanensis]
MTESTLDAVRANAVALCTQTPRPPSWIKVTAGEIAVELSFADGPAPVVLAAPVPAPVEPPEPEPEVVTTTRHITSPTVGVFYRAPEPGAEPFVAEGSVIAPGQQVGIVEAMKLMLPVEADHHGRVTEVLLTDGTPVEYGEPLLAYVPETA